MTGVEQRQVTLVGGPMDGQQFTTTVLRIELIGNGSSEDGLFLHVYDVDNDGHAIYRGVRTL